MLFRSGLAGLRIGYAIGSKKIINEINNHKLPFNLSSLQQRCALEALKDKEFIDKFKYKNDEVKNYFCNKLKESNFEYIESVTNFVMVDMKENATIMQEYLMTKGIQT